MTASITLSPSQATDGVDCDDSLTRRQEYKRMLLSEHYQAEISQALANQLLYVECRGDSTTLITLRDEDGSVAGQIHDQGDKMLALSQLVNDAEIYAMLELARTKGWTNLAPTGSPEFRARAAKLALAAGFTVDGVAAPQNSLSQTKKDRPMLGTPGSESMGLTPDTVPDHQDTAATRRWADALVNVKRQLLDEHKAAQARLTEIPEVDLKKLEKGLAAKHGGDEYKAARQAFKDADAKAKSAGALTRKRAEAEKETAWQAFLAVHAKALAVPAAAACFTKAQQHNQEREHLSASMALIKIGIGEIDHWKREIANGRDPETDFAQVWQQRKLKPLQHWQKLVIAPVMEADAARERARLQTEADAAEVVKTQARQVQTQQEIAAQKMADLISDQLSKHGLPAFQEEALQEQHRYYLALADGCDEKEAWERAKKVNAPRL